MIQITDFQILSKPYINGKIIIQLSDDAYISISQEWPSRLVLWSHVLPLIGCSKPLWPLTPGGGGDACSGVVDGEDPVRSGREPAGRRAGGDVPVRPHTLGDGAPRGHAHRRRSHAPLAGLLLCLHAPAHDRRQPQGLPHRRLGQGGRHHQRRLVAHGRRKWGHISTLWSRWSVRLINRSLFVNRYEWLQLPAHQLLRAVHVCGLR